jgi:hypothetical protein
MALVWLLVTEGLITLVVPHKNIPFAKQKLFSPLSFELRDLKNLKSDIRKYLFKNINFANIRA